MVAHEGGAKRNHGSFSIRSPGAPRLDWRRQVLLAGHGRLCRPKFLEGAKKVHGLDIEFTGIWNEKKHDGAWVKLLRKTLDAKGSQP